MASVLALLAERDTALRQLMALALKGAGCNVRQCSNVLQLKAELYSSPIRAAARALLVLNVEIGAHCASELAVLGRARASERIAGAAFVFVREFGGSKGLALSGLDQDSVLGVFEKPFDLDDLERIARAYCSRP
jgi:hypothetical protein